MCGIHGYVGSRNRSKYTTDFLTQAFITGQLRGEDSSGIFVVDVDVQEPEMHKLAVAGSVFVQDRKAAMLLEYASRTNVITVCHTRAATAGKVNYTNAHPFHVEAVDGSRSMFGVHNGTLSNWRNFAGSNKFDVDSEWAYHQIFTDGNDAFKKFNGAYCFVWWDSDNDKVLNMARNSQRPMFVAFTQDGGMAYASEAGMLYWLLERNGAKLDGKIIELTPNYRYKFEVGKLKEFTKEQIPTYTAPNTSYHGTSNRGTGSGSYTWKSDMDKVAEVFREELAALEPANVNVTVTREEVQCAIDLRINTERGRFRPTHAEGDGSKVYGIVTLNNQEMDGEIRNAEKLDWENSDNWEVTVIGCVDQPNLLTAVCSKPRVKMETAH